MGEETKNALDGLRADTLNLRAGQEDVLTAIRDQSAQSNSNAQRAIDTATDAASTASRVARVAANTAAVGSMGITKTLWALVANSTAMVIIVVVMLVALYQVQTAHSESIRILTDIIAQNRKEAGDVRVEQNRVIDTIRDAVKDLAQEVRALRLSGLRDK